MSRRQDGFTLVELLIASTIMLLILVATLTTLDNFTRVNARTTQHVTSIDSARTAMARLTRDLRDATASTVAADDVDDSVITRALPQDLVMRRIDPFATTTSANQTGVHTVRWCLDAAKGFLHRLTAPGVATAPAECPGTATGWRDTIQAQQIANVARPIFTYDNATVADITSVNTFLAIDKNIAKPPVEATLTSGIFLRNQNRRPVASFTYVALGGRNVQLNGQASRDPEGGILTYEWKDGTTVLPYTTAVASYVAPASGPRTITLTVKDVDQLPGTQTQTVQVKP